MITLRCSSIHESRHLVLVSYLPTVGFEGCAEGPFLIDANSCKVKVGLSKGSRIVIDEICGVECQVRTYRAGLKDLPYRHRLKDSQRIDIPVPVLPSLRLRTQYYERNSTIPCDHETHKGLG